METSTRSIGAAPDQATPRTTNLPARHRGAVGGPGDQGADALQANWLTDSAVTLPLVVVPLRLEEGLEWMASFHRNPTLREFISAMPRTGRPKFSTSQSLVPQDVPRNHVSDGDAR
jgi:hypothetical protein